jgi:hypothetical protein
MKEGKRYEFYIDAEDFLARARSALALFKTSDDTQQLFVAALMLRLGIEARLFEYIEAELQQQSQRDQLRKISEFQATKLLARLVRMNPDAKTGVEIVMRPNGSNESIGFRYTPITDSLASIHGRLGELLHFNFFLKNPHWYVAARDDTSGVPTLLHAQDLIEKGIDELAEATSGDLLTHPQFHSAVRRIVDDLAAESSRGLDPSDEVA